MAISFEELTLGEIATVEDLTGVAIDSLADLSRPKGKMLAAMAYVAQLRVDPTFTFNDALGLTMTDLDQIITLGDDDEDTEAPKEIEPVADEYTPSD